MKLVSQQHEKVTSLNVSSCSGTRMAAYLQVLKYENSVSKCMFDVVKIKGECVQVVEGKGCLFDIELGAS